MDNKELQEKEIKKLDGIWEEIKRKIEEKDYFVAFKLMKHMYLSSYTAIRLLATEENKQLEKQIIKAFNEDFSYDDFIKREG